LQVKLNDVIMQSILHLGIVSVSIEMSCPNVFTCPTSCWADRASINRLPPACGRQAKNMRARLAEDAPASPCCRFKAGVEAGMTFVI